MHFVVELYKRYERNGKQKSIAHNLRGVEGYSRNIHCYKACKNHFGVKEKSLSRESDKGVHGGSKHAEKQCDYYCRKGRHNGCQHTVFHFEKGKKTKTQRHKIPVDEVGNNPCVYAPNGHIYRNKHQNGGYRHRKPPHIGAQGNENCYHFNVGQKSKRFFACNQNGCEHRRYAQFQRYVFPHAFCFHDFKPSLQIHE